MTQPLLMNPLFLIDANCLIEPYNRYYNPQFTLSAPFWQHLHNLVNSGRVTIIDKVRDEVYGHNCPEVDTWLDAINSLLVICEEEDGIIQASPDLKMDTNPQHFVNGLTNKLPTPG